MREGKDNIKKFIMNPWTIGIGTTILGVICTAIYDAINKQVTFTTIKTFLVNIWGLIIKFLMVNVKMWLILVVIIILVFILWIISKIVTAKDKNEEPEFINYKKDKLLGHDWEWTWEKNYNGQYEIKNLSLICSKCETPLYPEESFRPRLKCLRCDEVVDLDIKKIKQVEFLIIDNVKKGQYKIY